MRKRFACWTAGMGTLARLCEEHFVAFVVDWQDLLYPLFCRSALYIYSTPTPDTLLLGSQNLSQTLHELSCTV